MLEKNYKTIQNHNISIFDEVSFVLLYINKHIICKLNKNNTCN